ncbi:MAG: TrkA family potassium uptake protein [Candidatus Methanofastidiosia archaeon]|jgi:trk system potassium uptake protein TrkA
MYVIVAGAGIIGKAITKILVENNHDVVVIDRVREVCEAVYAETGAMTIQGNATDIRVLEEAGAAQADTILSLMRAHADNIACALLAKSLGIPKIVSLLRDPRYEQAYKEAGVTFIASAADLLINRIIMEVEQPKVRNIMTLGGGAEVYAVNIPENARIAGLMVKDIAGRADFPKECVFMGIYSEEDETFMIPRGDYVIEQGFTVFLVSKPQYIKQATNILTKV